MDSSQKALQINRKLFSNFEFVFELLAENQKNIKQITRLSLCKRDWGGICVISTRSSLMCRLETLLFNVQSINIIIQCAKYKHYYLMCRVETLFNVQNRIII